MEQHAIQQSMETVSDDVKLSEAFLAKYPNRPAHMKPIGMFTYLRTYARYLTKEKRREHWKETCIRAIEYNINLLRKFAEGKIANLQAQIERDEANGKVSVELLRAQIGILQQLIAELPQEAERLFDNMFNLRQFLSGRTLWVGGAPKGLANKFPLANFNCFAKDTEFLTKEGLKTFEEFNDGDEVEVLASTGGWKKATVRKFGKQELLKLTVRKGSRVEEIYTTDNHRWYARKHASEKRYAVKTTAELREGDVLRVKRTYEHTDIVPCSIGIQHGIVFGDGTYDQTKNHTRVHLCGEKKQLANSFTTGSQTTAGKFDQIVVYGLPSTWKELPPLTMNIEYLVGFLMGLLATDGSISNNQVTISNKNRSVMQWVRSVAMMAGLDVSAVRLVRDESPFDGSSAELYAVGFSSFTLTGDMFIREDQHAKFKQGDTELLWKVVGVEETERFEDVWCVQEPETESFTLGSGILTKNCSFTMIQELVRDMGDLFYLLLVGTGVGFRAPKELVAKLPPVNSSIKQTYREYVGVPKGFRQEDTTVDLLHPSVVRITVGDSKEGWVEAMRAWFRIVSGGVPEQVDTIEFDFNNIRPKGEKLETFGGTASGHEPLQEMFEGFDKVLKSQLDADLDPLAVDHVDSNGRVWVKLRPVHLLDMGNLTGYNVVVGGVRRTAELFGLDPDDFESMLAKYGINGLWGEEAFERHEELRKRMIDLGIPVPKFWDRLAVKYYYVYDPEDVRKGKMQPRKLAEFTDIEKARQFAYSVGYRDPAWINQPRKKRLAAKIKAKYLPLYLSPCNEKRPMHHRRMSNNSIFFIEKPSQEFLDFVFLLMRGEGEPGFINIYEVARRRLARKGITDHEAIVEEAKKLGLNPCAEILLKFFGVCNLTTVNAMAYVRGVRSLDREGLLEAQRMSARAGIRMTLAVMELDHWNERQEEDRLIGTSVTGWKNAMDALEFTSEEEEELLTQMRAVVHEESTAYSEALGINRPLLETTVKPEGTLTLVADAGSSGCHRSKGRTYIRRIRVNAADPVAKTARRSKGWVVNPEVGTEGATWEEKMENARTWVVDFPEKSTAKRTQQDEDVHEQFENYFMFQRAYTDHNTSNTINLHPHEWGTASKIIHERWSEFVGVSFMAHDGGTYELAPYENISEEEYERRVAAMEPFDLELLQQLDEESDMEANRSSVQADCATGACPV